MQLESIRKLAESSELCWQAIRARDAAGWGRASTQCLDAQLALFPGTATDELRSIRKKYEDRICGCKMTGAGGGGYMLLISDKPIENALQVVPSVM